LQRRLDRSVGTSAADCGYRHTRGHGEEFDDISALLGGRLARRCREHGQEPDTLRTEKTARFYETEKRLATEHPSLLDTEHGTPAAKPAPENGQGQLAAQFPLLTFHDAAAAVLSPEKAKLLAHKQELEAKIDELKYKKAAMQADDYKKQIAALLLDLAKTQAELDK